MGFCPSGLLSQWAFVLVGFCPSGLLSYTREGQIVVSVYGGINECLKKCPKKFQMSEQYWGCLDKMSEVNFSPAETLDTSMRCVLYIKMFNKFRNNVWFYLYCWSVNLVSLNGSDFIMIETTKKM